MNKQNGSPNITDEEFAARVVSAMTTEVHRVSRCAYCPLASSYPAWQRPLATDLGNCKHPHANGMSLDGIKYNERHPKCPLVTSRLTLAAYDVDYDRDENGQLKTEKILAEMAESEACNKANERARIAEFGKKVGE